jgi:hypothetical protein
MIRTKFNPRMNDSKTEVIRNVIAYHKHFDECSLIKYSIRELLCFINPSERQYYYKKFNMM